MEKELEQIVQYARELGIEIGYFSGVIHHSDGGTTAWSHHVSHTKSEPEEEEPMG